MGLVSIMILLVNRYEPRDFASILQVKGYFSRIAATRQRCTYGSCPVCVQMITSPFNEWNIPVVVMCSNTLSDSLLPV